MPLTQFRKEQLQALHEDALGRGNPTCLLCHNFILSRIHDSAGPSYGAYCREYLHVGTHVRWLNADYLGIAERRAVECPQLDMLP